MRSMESQVLDANARHLFEGIILRYGLFYGAENAMTKQLIALARRRLLPTVRGDQGLLPPIHLEDAASATVAALERGTPGSIYDIVDDHPVSMSEMARTIAETVGATKPFAIPSWLPRLLAPYMAQVLSLAAAAVEREGARRVRLAADVSDDPRRIFGRRCSMRE